MRLIGPAAQMPIEHRDTRSQSPTKFKQSVTSPRESRERCSPSQLDSSNLLAHPYLSCPLELVPETQETPTEGQIETALGSTGELLECDVVAVEARP
jgi:hypothetical protein